MLIVNDEQRLQAGIGSLSKRCSFLVDLYTFLSPPVPYERLFVLTTSNAAPSQQTAVERE